MYPKIPQEWPQVFVQHVNAGHLDAAMALYEPDAHFVTPSGETLVGRDAIRQVVASLIDAKTHSMRSQVIKTITVGDIAQLYTDFERTTIDGEGHTVTLHTKAIEILRRQPDGSWKLIVGDPNGRER